MNDIFISYARSQSEMADNLSIALKKRSVVCWVDRLNIGPAEKWHSALREGILSASNLLILLDENWINSDVCLQEYEYAVDFGKTLIPVIVDAISPSEWKEKRYQVPDELAGRNYIWSYKRDLYQIVDDIVAAARTDYKWKILLNRLELRAQRWKSSGETFGLLRGQELLGVQESVSNATGKEPFITDIVAQFIQASQQEEMRELEEQRERARQAESRSLAAKAESYCLEEPIESLHILNKAWRLAPSMEALQAIGHWYETHLHLAGVWKNNFSISSVAVDETNNKLASCEFISSLIIGDRPQQKLTVQDLRDLGKLDSLSDIHGFGGCLWARSQLVTLRKANIISYRYDLFKERYRQSTRGKVLPFHESKMVINASHTFIALPGIFEGLFLYDTSSDRIIKFQTNGRCVDAAWMDELTLLVVENGGLRRHHIEAFDDVVELIPPNHDIISVDTDGDNWIALSSSDRTMLYNSVPDGFNVVCLHHAPDPSIGIRFGPNKTAFIFGGGGSSNNKGIVEVEIDSGQVIREWIGGFEKRVNHFDPGMKKWMAAGRKDGLVLLWNQERISIETDACTCEPCFHTPTEAKFSDEGQCTFIEEGREIFSSQIEPPQGFPIIPGRLPCVRNDNIICVGCGNTLFWFNLDDPDKKIINKGSVHTNDISHLTCSETNSLWVSTAMNYRDNGMTEIYTWSRKTQWPILKLILQRVEYDQIAFDQSGKTLLFLFGERAVKSILIDPESWLEKGESLSNLEWTKMT